MVVFRQLPNKWWETPGVEGAREENTTLSLLLFTYKCHRNISIHFGFLQSAFFDQGLHPGLLLAVPL